MEPIIIVGYTTESLHVYLLPSLSVEPLSKEVGTSVFLNGTNDVAEDLDTKDLMMPFVKGDKARTDKHSSGLGLSIAKAAAEQNGFTLKISCRERVFKAILIF